MIDADNRPLWQRRAATLIEYGYLRNETEHDFCHSIVARTKPPTERSRAPSRRASIIHCFIECEQHPPIV